MLALFTFGEGFPDPIGEDFFEFLDETELVWLTIMLSMTVFWSGEADNPDLRSIYYSVSTFASLGLRFKSLLAYFNDIGL